MKKESSAGQAFWYFNMHWNTNLNAINDLHQVYWSESMLLYSRKGIHIYAHAGVLQHKIYNWIEFSLHVYEHFDFFLKVIDEVSHVLRTITNSSQSSKRKSLERSACGSQTTIFWSDQALRTHEVLQELRDISSMAIDHFDDKIAPTLKKAFGELPSRSFLNCVPHSITMLQRKYSKHTFEITAKGIRSF